MYTDLSGFVMGTGNGEETLLSPEEKIDIFKVVSNTLKNKKILIAGVDNPSILSKLPFSFLKVSPSTKLCPPLLGMPDGANGGCFMLGNIAPKICRKIIKLSLEKNFTEAKNLNDKLVNLDWNILSRKAAGIKYALDLLGFIGGNPRKPQNNLTEFDRKSISEAIENSGIKEVE